MAVIQKNTCAWRLAAFLFLAGWLGGCASEEISGNKEVIRMEEFSEHPWSDLPRAVREPEYIRLRTQGEESMLGEIEDVKILGDKIYVKDWRNKRLAIFSRQGEWQGSISRHGRGPGEYLNISEFDVAENGDLYIVDGTADKLLIYNSALAFVRETKLPFEVDNLKVLNPDTYLLAVSSWQKSGEMTGVQLVITDSLFRAKEVISRYTEHFDDNFWLSSSRIVTAKGEFFYQRQVNDSVYNLDAHGKLKKIYFFDMGSATVPLMERNNLEKLAESGALRNYSALIEFTVIGKDYIYGCLYDKGERALFVVDTKAGQLYKLPMKESGRYGIFRGTTKDYIISIVFPGVEDPALPEQGDDFVLGLYKIN